MATIILAKYGKYVRLLRPIPVTHIIYGREYKLIKDILLRATDPLEFNLICLNSVETILENIKFIFIYFNNHSNNSK